MQALTRGLVAAAIVLSFAAAASAADPALTCQAGKLSVAAKYGSCRLLAESKAVKASASPDFSKCLSKFSTKWESAEAKAGPGICPSELDEIDIDQRISAHADAIASLLAGGVAVDPYSPATGQTTSYGSGDDGDVQAGATQAFIDNADGTITDSNTGLMWEKKVQGTGGYTSCTTEVGTCANPHNADNAYRWSVGGTNYDGAVKTIFLNQLNNRCNNNTAVACTANADCSVPGGACGFAGHRDWRLPNENELLNIIDRSTYLPALNVAFHGASCGLACADLTNPACSCDASSFYWSATTVANYPAYAWDVSTYTGYTDGYSKTNALYARAVRGGS